jgi:hypothetical protein
MLFHYLLSLRRRKREETQMWKFPIEEGSYMATPKRIGDMSDGTYLLQSWGYKYGQ